MPILKITRKIKEKRFLYPFLGIIITVFGYFLVTSTSTFEFINGSNTAMINKFKGLITGTDCNHSNERPLAAMLSSDPEARPLSGIGQADIVFEMPVTPNGVTRMMAIFQCENPQEIGSIRSARLDFIPLVSSFDAFYAHFGGEKEALSQLDSGILDNIDGLKYDDLNYYRKNTIPRPHNAFTNIELLNKVIDQLDYKRDYAFEGYKHSSNNHARGIQSPNPIYEGAFKVSWQYDPENNSYLRTRDARKELDKNTGQQVAVKNVVIMTTTWSPISKDYLRILTVGSGQATIYKNGQSINGSWVKKDASSKLYFYDSTGKEVEFLPGKIWVEIVV